MNSTCTGSRLAPAASSSLPHPQSQSDSVMPRRPVPRFVVLGVRCQVTVNPSVNVRARARAAWRYDRTVPRPPLPAHFIVSGHHRRDAPLFTLYSLLFTLYSLLFTLHSLLF